MDTNIGTYLIHFHSRETQILSHGKNGKVWIFPGFWSYQDRKCGFQISVVDIVTPFLSGQIIMGTWSKSLNSFFVKIHVLYTRIKLQTCKFGLQEPYRSCHSAN